MADSHARMESHAFVALVLALMAGFIAEALSAAFAHANMDWYLTLAKPGFMPPAIVFPFAWTGVFVLLALGVWQFRRTPDGGESKRPGLIAFGAVLLLNVVFSFVYFGLRSQIGGTAVMLLLLVAAVVTIVLFDRVSRKAALLIVPYLLWIALLTAVNVGTLMLNA